VACAGPVGLDRASLDLSPTTFEEAEGVLAQIDEALAIDPNDEVALQALQDLQPALDALNGVVARVEVAPGHAVTFYEPEPGAIGIEEMRPEGSPSLLVERAELAGMTPAQLYAELSGSDAIPSALIAASEAIEAEAPDLVAGGQHGDLLEGSEGVGASHAALTASDGPFFQSNHCFSQGDFKLCLPNWANGGYLDVNTKTSFLVLAPYGGAVVNPRMKYNGSIRFLGTVYSGQVANYWWRSGVRRECAGSWPWPTYCIEEHVIANHRIDILNASGDGFHWSAAAKWSCGSVASCDAWPAQ